MLKGIEDLAKSGVANVIKWSMTGQKETYLMPRQPKDDVLRRAIYNGELSRVFPDWPRQLPDEPLLMPDKAVEWVVDKFATNMFPAGTVYSVADERVNDLLQHIIEVTRLEMKTKEICKEAALMGYCGLRSVWSEKLNDWITEVKPREHLRIETDPFCREIIVANGVCYPIEKGGKIYWYKERWTKEEYWLWPLKEGGLGGQEPEFKPEDAIVTPHAFGDIPITLVFHEFSSSCIAESAVSSKDILESKALIRLRNKRHFAHLEHLDPTLVITNDESGKPIRRGVGAIIRLSSGDKESPASAELLESSGIPESVKEEITDLISNIFRSAGLTPPNEDEIMKAGTDMPGVALRIRDKGEATTIDGLRLKGYSQVLRHLDKMLKMGARTRKTPEYFAVVESNKETWSVEAKYPPFFPPTDQDILLKQQILKASHLSAKEKAEREAQFMGVDSPEEIQIMIDNIETEAEQEAMALNNDIPPA